MKTAAQSDTGRLRQINEDSYLEDPKNGLFAVADGMGGHKAGEIASSMALEVLVSTLTDDKPTRSRIEKKLKDAINEANKTIFSSSANQPEYKGMGTTIVAAVFDNKDLIIANVGDSRVYRIRNGEITRLTKDHTLLFEMIKRGEVDSKLARLHPLRNIITRALGTHRKVDADIKRHLLVDGDMFLLCSDGLTSMLEDKEILSIIKDAGSLNESVKCLIKQANKAGGEDNITVVLVEP